MERRREPRSPVRQQVAVTDLTHQLRLDPSEILDYSGRGMALHVSAHSPLNSAVQIEWREAVLLGYVCHVQESEGGFRLGLMLDHVFAGSRDVSQLLKTLQEEVSRCAAPGVSA